jgi:hypothetical protein
MGEMEITSGYVVDDLRTRQRPSERVTVVHPG